MHSQPDAPEPSHPEGQTEPEYELIRLPEHVAAGLILAFLVVIFGAGLLANRYLRPPTGIVATPIPTETPVALSTSTPAPVAMGALATPTPAVLRPTATAPSPPTATALATSTPGVTATVEATARPTVNPLLQEQVSQAYQHYWDVRARALYDLDTTHLPEVMAGEHLAAVEARIRELRAQGRAIETDVEHSYVVVEASADHAQVGDIYVSNSIYVDVTTRAPLSQPVAETLTERYELSRIGGTWKVVNLARAN